MKTRHIVAVVLLMFCVGGPFGSVALALSDNDTDLMQTILPTGLSAGVTDGQNNPITRPAVIFPTKVFSFDCQNAADDYMNYTVYQGDAQNISVNVPEGSTPNGWRVAIAASDQNQMWWRGAQSGHYMDFNDAHDNGCSAGPEGIDNDTFGGLLSVWPGAVSGIMDDCSGICTHDGVHLGAKNNFANTDSITLLESDGPGGAWRGHITMPLLRQTIPGGQPADRYTIPMTISMYQL